MGANDVSEADPKIEALQSLALKPAFAVRLLSILKVSPFVFPDDMRPYLSGVRVEPCDKGGALCVATDGHRLGVQRDPGGLVLQPATVRLPKLLKAPTAADLKKCARGPWLVCMANSSGFGTLSLVDPIRAADSDTADAAIARVEMATIRLGNVLCPDNYPDWRRVVPTATERDVTRSFNPKYIAAFGSNATLTGAGKDSPHLVCTSDRDFIGVLMPMRPVEHARPDWLGVAKAAA
jgi:hypothetical protein